MTGRRKTNKTELVPGFDGITAWLKRHYFVKLIPRSYDLQFSETH